MNQPASLDQAATWGLLGASALACFCITLVVTALAGKFGKKK